jgi:hypothetical protein
MNPKVAIVPASYGEKAIKTRVAVRKMWLYASCDACFDMNLGKTSAKVFEAKRGDAAVTGSQVYNLYFRK